MCRHVAVKHLAHVSIFEPLDEVMWKLSRCIQTVIDEAIAVESKNIHPFITGCFAFWERDDCLKLVIKDDVKLWSDFPGCDVET